LARSTSETGTTTTSSLSSKRGALRLGLFGSLGLVALGFGSGGLVRLCDRLVGGFGIGRSLLLGGEYYWQKVRSSETGNPWFYGGEAVVSWITTGEIRSYNLAGNYFREVSPDSTVIQGGPGAWAPLIKFSYSNLTNGPVQGGIFWRLTPMLNWYLTDNVRLEFASGCVANLTASRVSTERVRKVRFFQPHQYLSIDYGRQDLLVFTVNPSGTNPVPGQPDSMIQVTKPVIGAVGATEEPLRAELRSFLAAVRTRSRPVVSFEDARNALAVALDILSAIQKHSQRIQLPSLR